MPWIDRIIFRVLDPDWWAEPDITKSISGKTLSSNSNSIISSLNIDWRREYQFMHVWESSNGIRRMCLE